MKKVILIFLIVLTSCKSEVLPKPKGYLSLQYPKKTYKKRHSIECLKDRVRSGLKPSLRVETPK